MAKVRVDLQSLKIPFKNYLTFSFFAALTTLLLVVFLQKKLPPQVPLLYGAAEGVGQLVSSWGLTIPSLVSIFVIILNAALASFSKDDFARKTLVLMALVVTLFSIVTTLKIIFLVGSF